MRFRTRLILIAGLLGLLLPGCAEDAAAPDGQPESAPVAQASRARTELPVAPPPPPAPARPRFEAELPGGSVTAPALPASPGVDPLPPWELAEAPTVLTWTHPGPAADLSVQLVDTKGGGWPSRVQLKDVAGKRTARIVLLAPPPAGAELSLIVSNGADVWTQPLRLRSSSTSN
jgi:hypothetical protein